MPPPDEGAPAPRLEGVRRSFRSGKRVVAAIDGVTASAARGAVTGLIGPDGAGKTTLMRLIAGLLRPPLFYNQTDIRTKSTLSRCSTATPAKCAFSIPCSWGDSNSYSCRLYTVCLRSHKLQYGISRRAALTTAAPLGGSARVQSSPTSSRGCAPSSRSSARRASSPRRSVMRCRVGKA